MKNTKSIIYCLFISWLLLNCDEKESKKYTITAPEDAKPGIGFLTIKNQALKANQTKFEFFDDENLSQGLAEFDAKTGKSSSEKLMPEYLDIQNNICYFRCVGWDPKKYYVVSNPETQAWKYIKMDTSRYRYVTWNDFLLNVGKITRLNPEENPIKTRPNPKALNANWDKVTSNEFILKDIYKKWAKVSDLGNNHEGWIIWVEQEKLKVKFDATLVKPLSKMKLEKDPTANPLNFKVGH